MGLPFAMLNSRFKLDICARLLNFMLNKTVINSMAAIRIFLRFNLFRGQEYRLDLTLFKVTYIDVRELLLLKAIFRASLFNEFQLATA